MRAFATLRDYRLGLLGRNLSARIMLAAIAIPERLVTSRLAGFPVEAGLWAFVAGTLMFCDRRRERLARSRDTGKRQAMLAVGTHWRPSARSNTQIILQTLNRLFGKTN